MKKALFLIVFLFGCNDIIGLPSSSDSDRSTINRDYESKYLIGTEREEFIDDINEIFGNNHDIVMKRCLGTNWLSKKDMDCFNDAIIEPIKRLCYSFWLANTLGPVNEIEYAKCVSKKISDFTLTWS